MDNKKFSEADKVKLIKYVNLVAQKARFSDMDTKDIIEFYGLMSFVQKTLIPKVEANILEVVDVIEADKTEDSPEKTEE